MATYAAATAERRRVMANYRVTTRVVKDGPNDSDWELQYKDSRLQTETTSTIIALGWPDRFMVPVPQTVAAMQILFP